MTTSKLLIITNSRSKSDKFLAPPYNLSIEDFYVTGIKSLEYIGFSAYKAVVIDFDATDVIKKISLGINDDSMSCSLWQLIAKNNNTSLYHLVDKITQPSRDMKLLDIKYIRPSELKNLVGKESAKDECAANDGKTLLTAGDIREMHVSGVTEISNSNSMTPWAKEVADSYDMTEEYEGQIKIFPIEAQTKLELSKLSEMLFHLSSQHSDLLFALPSPIIPVFRRMFPALGNRIVAIGISWAEKGAFTGENSYRMLNDQQCRGAIIPNKEPYLNKENLASIVKIVSDSGFKLFSYFPLADDGECGIINRNIMHLFDARSSEKKAGDECRAIVVDKKYLLNR